MTQDHSALLAQLDALKSADASAVFAELIRSGLQQLIEAEATGGSPIPSPPGFRVAVCLI
jgi:hypothetical protein